MTNATLLRIDTPPTPTTGGDVGTYTTGSALSVRCVLDEPTFLIQRQIDEMKLTANAVLYVKLSDYPTAGAVLVADKMVRVQQDGGAVQMLRIEHASLRVFGGLSHVMALCRSL